MATLRIIYDGDCPFCSSYVALLRLREQYDVRLVDARKEPALAAQYGLDLNEGMIVDLDGKVHHGAAPCRFCRGSPARSARRARNGSRAWSIRCFGSAATSR